MTGRHDDHEPVAGHGLRVETGRDARSLDEAEVGGAVEHLRGDVRGVEGGEADGRLGAARGEADEPERHQVLGDGEARGHPQPDLAVVAQRADAGLEHRGRVQDVARPVGQQRALGGQRRAARAAGDEREPDQALHALDPRRDGRLADAVLGSGQTEAARGRHPDEQLERVEVGHVGETHHSSLCATHSMNSMTRSARDGYPPASSSHHAGRMTTTLDRAGVRRLSAVGPNWYASVMATGIVANASVTLPVPGLHRFGLAVWLLAVLLLVVVTAATVAHWVRHPATARGPPAASRARHLLRRDADGAPDGRRRCAAVRPRPRRAARGARRGLDALARRHGRGSPLCGRGAPPGVHRRRVRGLADARRAAHGLRRDRRPPRGRDARRHGTADDARRVLRPVRARPGRERRRARAHRATAAPARRRPGRARADALDRARSARAVDHRRARAGRRSRRAAARSGSGTGSWPGCSRCPGSPWSSS